MFLWRSTLHLDPTRPATAPQGLWLGEQGSAMVEYVILLGVVVIVVAVAIAGLGPVLLASYERARGILVSPIP